MFRKRILKVIKKKVDEIAEKAIELGWTKRQLYLNKGRFSWPHGNEWGVVTFIDKDEEITEVTAEYIEVESPIGKKSRVYKKNRK